MIRLCGAKSNVETVLALARPHGTGSSGLGEVRDALRAFLDSVQPDVPRRPGSIAYVFEGPDHERLVATFDSDSFLDDTAYEFGKPDDARVGQRRLEEIESALNTLGEADSTSKDIFELTMFTVFWAPCRVAAGGTTSQALGILWADPRPWWSERDLVEFLIHELTHTLIFLDEWRQPQFSSREALTDRSNYALSAIRGAPRPLDKTLHSIIVGVEVLLAREEALGHTEHDGLHPGSRELYEGVTRSIASIRDVAGRNASLAPRGWELLDACDSSLSTLPAPVGT
jgi:hypothetical protein